MCGVVHGARELCDGFVVPPADQPKPIIKQRAVASERERCEKICEAELVSFAEEGGEIWIVGRILDKIRSGEHAE